MNFSNLKIGHKLQLAFGAMILLTAILGGLAISKLASVNHDAEDLGTSWLPSVQLLGELSNDITNIRRQELQHVLSVSKEEMKEYDDNLAATLRGMGGDLARYEKLITSPEEKKLYDEFGKLWADFMATHEKLIPLSRAGGEKIEEARALVRGDSAKSFGAAAAKLQELVKLNADGADAATKQAASTYGSARAWIVGELAVVIALGFGLALFISHRITAPLKEAMGVAQRIAAGDLTARIEAKGSDETGQLVTALAEMQNQLQALIGQIHESADEVSSSSTQLSASSTQVAHGTQTQSEAASSMAASVEEVTVSIGHVADSAQEAHRIALDSGRESQQGAAVIQSAAQEMAKIAQSVQESAALIQDLGQRSNEISAIVKTIKGIADQTNLLALNAAIEAARAGEQGRGFAVVADEVRQLAERTAKATNEIGGMIEGILSGTQTAVVSMEAGVVQVNEGLALANQAGDAIGRIQQSAERVVKVVDDISAALSEQSTAAQDIARRVEQIAQMSEENSAAVEESASAAHHLENLATSLQDTVARFKV